MFNIGAFFKDMFPPVETIQPMDAWTAAKKGKIVLIDVREAREIAASGKCKGALNVPMSMIRQKAGSGAEPFAPSNTFALYCANGARSLMAARTMKKLGYENVYNLGTFRDWVGAGLPVEK
ncbi:Rhodanese-like domain protein [Rhodovulum sp. P5]|uniref:rhodanese-like domain-containing protein n=1 Tax=Rhodovulum sp. P5 TaxID=1564506 RepID=UPI0009C1E298|nr:rhodanese-like domain-containing protein [Rhodovulum sp. P5]ARE42041.1 Rhodanese-like domain protein [Rhodovulum sp. P5]